MKIYRHLPDILTRDKLGAVAIGNFDGVHLGHKRVIKEAGDVARIINIPWTVLTFEPHPREFFRNNLPPFRLTPFRAKVQRIKELGVDVIVVLKFDLQLCHCEAEAFIKHVLVDGLAARHVIAGYDFHFGHKRKGDCSMLLQFGKKLGFDFTAVSAASDDGGGVYASTKIRELLQEGDIVRARKILGRPFSISGIVKAGARLGRKIGYPTANISLGPYVRPRFGIYVVRAFFELNPDLPPLQGVANIGTRPTVDGKQELLESFFFDFKGDLYGQRLNVELLKFIRPEEKFPDVKAMANQISKDCEVGRAYFQ